MCFRGVKHQSLDLATVISFMELMWKGYIIIHQLFILLRNEKICTSFAWTMVDWPGL